MNDQFADQLNQFYRDFNAGRIDFAEYRNRRGLLLDSLVDINSRQGDNLETLPRKSKAPETEPPPVREVASEPKKPLGKGIKLAAVILVSIVVALAVVLIVSNQIRRDEPEITRTPRRSDASESMDLNELNDLMTATEVVESEDPPPDAGQVLVENFVAAQDWRRTSVNQFQDSWGRLPAADRIIAKGAVWFKPLALELGDQIDGAKAVALDPNDDRELDVLYEFALRLGLVELVPPGWTPNVAPPPAAPVAIQSSPVASVRKPPQKIPVPASEVPVPEAAVAKSAPVVVETPVSRTNKNACSEAQLLTRRRNCFDLITDEATGPLLKVIPAGSITVTDGKVAARNVVVSKPFAISIYELTQEEYAAYCIATSLNCDGREWPGENMPKVNVSWHDAVAYCEWLSTVTGQRYRLPSNSEWEYAARAGADSVYPYGDKLGPAQARYSSVNDYTEPLPTTDDTTQRNQFGLWHVIGNVGEWVATDDAGDNVAGRKPARGGSYASGADDVRSSSIEWLNPGERNRETGFRVAREL